MIITLECDWLLRPSFIPPRHIRDLRELARYRFTLIKELGSVANRIQMIAESANIKLSEVVSDALGKSSKAMLRALADGESDVMKLSDYARGRLRSKKPQLRLALDGRLSETQRWVLAQHLDRDEELEGSIRKAEEKIEEVIKALPDPFIGEAIELLDTIPGVGRRIAEIIVAEIGANMEQFPTGKHLASWAGMCPATMNRVAND